MGKKTYMHRFPKGSELEKLSKRTGCMNLSRTPTEEEARKINAELDAMDADRAKRAKK